MSEHTGCQPNTKTKNSDGRSMFFIYFILIVVVVITLYPVIYMVSLSLSSPDAVSRGEVTFLPVGLNLDTYKYVLGDAGIGRAYLNTILYAVLGTVASVLMTGLVAYPLSVPSFGLRKLNTILLMITMYFGGGLIPYYMIIKNLHMINTMWVMILPGAVSAYNAIIYRTFFSDIPPALRESAFIDGANDITIFFKIMIPLSKPLLATMSLFSMVGIWNDYFTPMIFLNDTAKQPLQMILRQMVIQVDMSVQNMSVANVIRQLAVNSRTVRAATIMVTMLPIMCVYPFLQKYFASGVMIGSVKG